MLTRSLIEARNAFADGPLADTDDATYSRYDAADRRTRLTHPDGAYFTMTYDPADRMGSALENGAASLFTQAFSPFGDRASMTRGGSSSTFGYDGISRLTSLVHNLSGTTRDATWTFAYNPASQIVTRTLSNDAYAWTAHVEGEKAYAVNGLNQYTTVAATAHTYDPNGNLTSDGTTTYVYDAENRLVSGTASGQTATLTYDPMGRLWQVVKGTANTRFLYDGDALVTEYNSSGTVTARFVHGSNAADDPLVWYSGAGITGERWLHADHLGSIVATTNTSGGSPTINAYDEYGIPASTNTGRFQYTGQIWLSELGLYYYKARFYGPGKGRFLQTDPVGYDDQVNLYAYVANDPVNMTDPTGMDGGCFYGPSQCGLRELTPEQQQRREETVSRLGTVAITAASFLPAGRLIGWAGAIVKRVLGSDGAQATTKTGDSAASNAAQRPNGVPKNFEPSPTDKGGGTKYTDPANPHNNVRDMPGNPNSPNPAQQNPYVKENVLGQPIDGAGRPVSRNSPESHIPRDQYQYRGKVRPDE